MESEEKDFISKNGKINLVIQNKTDEYLDDVRYSFMWLLSFLIGVSIFFPLDFLRIIVIIGVWIIGVFAFSWYRYRDFLFFASHDGTQQVTFTSMANYLSAKIELKDRINFFD